MNNQPLATKIRPNTLKDILGQNHLIGEGKILSRLIESKTLSSIILYGKPGIGKTTIAHALSNDLNLEFNYFNAGVHGKKELQKIVKDVTPKNKKVILIDEIHRLDKPKQDFLLMYIEEGSIITVGATTENPYISMTPAFRSRSHIFELKTINPKDIIKRLKKGLDVLKDELEVDINISPEMLEIIANKSGNDLRKAINSLELIVKSTNAKDGTINITKTIINECITGKNIGGDKDGDSHYNLLSAFQKSIRGSDTDASLHYLARLIRNGDLISIIRRLLVISYEDIGLANTEIHSEVLSALSSAERVGLPEAKIPLAYIVVRLSLSPKSNTSYNAFKMADNALDENKNLDIPKHLKDSHYKGANKLGNGNEYKYPHDYKFNITKQDYLPNDFKNDKYLQFKNSHNTGNIEKMYKSINKIIKE